MLEIVGMGNPFRRDWETDIYPVPPPMTIDTDREYGAAVITNQGSMVFHLLPAEAPMAVNSFVFLARERFYNGLWFHRIIQGFLIQGGDPTGRGSGSTGYTFPDEPVTRDYVRGTLAMANARPHGNSSQFFVVHRDANLPKRYTIFGSLREGFDVLDKLAATPVAEGPTGEASRPIEPAVIQRIEIVEGPGEGSAPP